MLFEQLFVKTTCERPKYTKNLDNDTKIKTIERKNKNIIYA